MKQLEDLSLTRTGSTDMMETGSYVRVYLKTICLPLSLCGRAFFVSKKL